MKNEGFSEIIDVDMIGVFNTPSNIDIADLKEISREQLVCSEAFLNAFYNVYNMEEEDVGEEEQEDEKSLSSYY